MDKLRILFVDDEPSVLDGLRRLLRKQSQEWDMQFVNSATEALQHLGAGAVDVVVTDMQMPGMTGADLLEKVVQEHPEVGRIVLSGHVDEKLAIRATRVAHQFLAKPVDPETLKRAVAKARPQGALSNNARLRTVVGRCQRLPVLPTLCAELDHLLNGDGADSKKVAALISSDPGMSSKILQLVNSSFFGIGRRVSSIEMAVTLLGTVRIQALVLREQLFSMFAQIPSIPHFSLERLLDRSLQVAELARHITKAEGQSGDRPDQAFTAGLLHDVGVLLLATVHAEYPSVFKAIHDQQRPICDVEMEQLDVTHAEVGGYLLSLWGLPSRIVEGVLLHHTPLAVPYDGFCAVTAVHSADALLSVVEQESAGEGLAMLVAPALNQEYLQRVGVGDRVPKWQELCQEILARALAQTAA